MRFYSFGGIIAVTTMAAAAAQVAAALTTRPPAGRAFGSDPVLTRKDGSGLTVSQDNISPYQSVQATTTPGRRRL